MPAAPRHPPAGASPGSAPADPAAAAAGQRGSGALWLIASAFLATALLRANDMRHELLAVIAPPARAAEAQAEPTAEAPAATSTEPASTEPASTAPETAMPETAVPPDMGPAPGAPKTAAASASEDALLQAVRERERELAAMDLALAERRSELAVIERRVAAQIAELTRQERALQAAFGQAETAAEEEAMQLVAIYEKMKPKQAAQIFDQMPPEVAAGFVRRMRQASSALILADMEPQKAFAISLLLAGRSAAVRTE